MDKQMRINAKEIPDEKLNKEFTLANNTLDKI